MENIKDKLLDLVAATICVVLAAVVMCGAIASLVGFVIILIIAVMNIKSVGWVIIVITLGTLTLLAVCDWAIKRASKL
jgi:hypothetical protein